VHNSTMRRSADDGHDLAGEGELVHQQMRGN
jgi:hypothetical protein